MPRQRNRLHHDTVLPQADNIWFFDGTHGETTWIQGRRQFFVTFEYGPTEAKISPGAGLDVVTCWAIRGGLVGDSEQARFRARTKEPGAQLRPRSPRM